MVLVVVYVIYPQHKTRQEKKTQPNTNQHETTHHKHNVSQTNVQRPVDVSVKNTETASSKTVSYFAERCMTTRRPKLLWIIVHTPVHAVPADRPRDADIGAMHDPLVVCVAGVLVGGFVEFFGGCWCKFCVHCLVSMALLLCDV